MKILIGVVGSAADSLKARMVARMAKLQDIEATMLYCQPPVYSFQKKMAYGDIVKNPKERSLSLENTRDILKRGGVEVKLLKREKEPVEELIQESQKGYDMVVVGSRGLSGIDKFLFHSVSEQVATFSSVPVMIIKKDVEISRVLVCTDGSDNARRAGIYAAELLEKAKPEITVLSVAPDEENLQEAANSASAELSQELMGKGAKVKSKVRTGDLIQEIVSESEDYGLTVLAPRGLGRIKRLLLGHVSQKVIDRTQTNVLIVR